jgi:hypothetical protein
MYIIELIVKLVRKIRDKRFGGNEFPPVILPGFDENTPSARQEDCNNHVYLPIDSIKQYLACKNCGHIIKNDRHCEPEI